jgi:polyphenol oxidase
VHGRAVHVVRPHDESSGLAAQPEADAIVTDVPGSVIAVQVADCVPMLVADRASGAVGAIHAGWRGAVAGVARATVDALAREFGTRPADLVIAAGPSIGACCYEVGEELIAAFRDAGATAAQLDRWFTRVDVGAVRSLRLDLWQVTHDQLVDAGVPPDQIYMSRLCTQTHADVFDSYRVAGPRAGRMIAAISR